MKALEAFIVELKNNVNDTITTDSGLELYVDTRFNEFDYRVNEGPIHNPPARYETGAKPGDTLYFHHHVVLDKGQIMPGEEDKYLVFYNEQQASANQAIAYKDQETGEIHQLFGWALLEPYEEEEKKDSEIIEVVKLKQSPVTKGKVAFGVKEVGLEKGDVVGFKKNRDYRIKIDGKEYYRVAVTELLYKQL
jgi:co-chaperonin GroES (HSP10)